MTTGNGPGGRVRRDPVNDRWEGIVSGATKEVEPPVEPPEQPAPETRRARTSRWRSWVPWVLIVLATVIGLLAALNVWVKRQALNTDHWTNASAQLLENNDIRNAISVYVVDQLYQNVDVGKALQDRLPPATKQLGPPLAAALEPALVRTTDTILGRPRVQAVWKNANRRAHQLFIAVLDGKHGVLVSTNDKVVLDLRPLVKQVVEEAGLGGRVVQKLPPDAGQIVIMNGNQLETARKTVKVIRATSFFLVFLVLALFAAAISIATGRRRRMLLAAGISLIVVGLLVLIVRRFAGNYLVDALTGNPDAKRPVSAAWAIGTELLRNVGINILIFGILALIGAWLAGPSRAATAVRRWSAPTIRQHPAVVFGLVTLVFLILLLTGPTDGDRVYPLLVLFALALVGAEVLRRQTEREFPEAVPAAEPEVPDARAALGAGP
jgi:hypothetical protein